MNPRSGAVVIYPVLLSEKKNITIACISLQSSHLSSLLAIWNVSSGGMSAPQRQKFLIDDVKFVRNLVGSSEWSNSVLLFGSLLTLIYNFISQEGNLVCGRRNVLKTFHSKFYPHFAKNKKNSPQQKDGLSHQPVYGASRNALPIFLNVSSHVTHHSYTVITVTVKTVQLNILTYSDTVVYICRTLTD